MSAEAASLETAPAPGPVAARVELILRLLLGGVFVYAGFLKLQDPTAFLYSIRSFHLLEDPWAPLLAVTLPWLEIFCGLAVLVRLLYTGALVFLNGSLLVFLWALAYSWHRGLNVDCGCFGRADFGDSYPYYIVRDLTLLFPALWLLWRDVKKKSAAE